MGYETLSFEEAVACETKRLWGERERIILHDGLYDSYAHEHFSYLARGVYVDQIKVWKCLFQTNQMLILCSETFYAKPASTLDNVFTFLNLPSQDLKDDIVYQHSIYPEMPADTRKRLGEYFRPHNERLYDFLDRDFGWG